MGSFSAQRTETPRRPILFTSGLLFRVLFALLVSFLIVMAFFATNAMSH